ncbi:MAG: 4-carboxy-4-hydroxy-2-oxoadipate aldolase/oxaloacetate decarboxylase [Bacillota bacterium]|nr:4-carboxy-4-hydroxy-2-oxoadipate aldolase/oxaloacetate decarboxylase [Bacillota bacterium]
MAAGFGFRIIESIERPEREVVERLAKLPTGNVADVMGRFRSMDGGIKPVDQRMRVCGPAVTVMTRPGDNLMCHMAMEIARPGDVVVVNTGHGVYAAVWGELMTHAAMAAGLGGLVVDGAVRDLSELRQLGFPVFARAIVASSCDKDGPGEINVPIACGGAVVMPGDVIVGDEDSVVVVPREWAAEVADLAEAKAAEEKARIAEIAAGQIFMPSIREALRRKGVLD